MTTPRPLSPTPASDPGHVPNLTSSQQVAVGHAREFGSPEDVPGRLGDHLGVLGAALVTWGTRDDSMAQPEVTRAGHTAVEVIDAMLAELHRARQQLVDEIREHQDAELARVDAMLAELRAAKDRGGARWPVLDSEPWTCTGCGGQMIGRRTASDRCRDCSRRSADKLAERAMDVIDRAVVEGRLPG
jgi:hypothetical protein